MVEKKPYIHGDSDVFIILNDKNINSCPRSSFEIMHLFGATLILFTLCN